MVFSHDLIFGICVVIHPFHNTKLSNIGHIYINVNEYSFINIYMDMDNTRKFYIMKRMELQSVCMLVKWCVYIFIYLFILRIKCISESDSKEANKL